MKNEVFICSFCSKTSNDVKKLVHGDHAYICDGCVDVCYDLVYEKPTSVEKEIKKEQVSITPKNIKEYLDIYIVGQESAKQALSVSVYNHFKQLNSSSEDGIELQKSNVLMLGNSGTGKTLFAQTIARFLDVPCVIVDATSLTSAGYVGEDVENILLKLYQASGADIEKTERGIIFIDEIDKKAKRVGSPHSLDISGEAVQQGLLKLLEDTVVQLQSKKRPGEVIKISTKNIMFICGGAFAGINEIVESASNTGSRIGFGASITPNKIDSSIDIEPEHLVKFGLIPEFIGRLPTVIRLSDLDQDQLVRILHEPKNSFVKQYQKLFAMDEIELSFDDEALIKVASMALQHKTGARGLRRILDKKLFKIQYTLPELRNNGVKKIQVTEETIEKDKEPVYFY